MQTRTKESKKRLHSLILLTAFTAVLLIVSTYAWFTTQKSVSIANIRGRVQVAEGLEISLDGEKWTQTIDLGDTEHVSLTAQEGVTDPDVYSKLIYKPYATHENNVPSEFKPVSSSGETFAQPADQGGPGMTIVDGARDKMVMLAGTYDGERLRNVSLASDAGGDYFAFDIFVRNSSKTGAVSDVLQLNHTSSAWVSPDGSDENDPVLKDANGVSFVGNPLYGIQNTVRVGFARYGAAAGIDADKSNEEQDPTSQYFIDAETSPADIISKTDLQPITAVSIWEPNANAHSKYAVDNTKLLFDQVIGTGNPAQSTYLTSETSNKFFTKTLKYAAFGKIGADGIDVFDWDNTDTLYTDTLNFLHTTQTTALDGTVKDVNGNIITKDERFPMIEDGIQNLKVVETIASPNTVDLTDKTGVNINSADYLFEKLKTKDLTIAANSITKFRIYVWIEGQDPDCTNYASSGGGLEINLSLCKGETERSKQNTVPTDDRVTVCMPGTCKDKVINETGLEGRDAKCDVCGSFVSCTAAGFECVDDVRDGKCDICARPVACIPGDDTMDHADVDPRDAICDYCGEAVACEEGACEDEFMYNEAGEKVPGHDSLCDICNTPHECSEYDRDCIDDEDTTFGTRNCDVCDKVLTCQDLDPDAECIDAFDNVQPTIEKADGKCDHCGETVDPEIGN